MIDQLPEKTSFWADLSAAAECWDPWKTPCDKSWQVNGTEAQMKMPIVEKSTASLKSTWDWEREEVLVTQDIQKAEFKLLYISI